MYGQTCTTKPPCTKLLHIIQLISSTLPLSQTIRIFLSISLILQLSPYHSNAYTTDQTLSVYTYTHFIYYSPDCPSCLAHLNSTGWAIWATWTAIKKRSLKRLLSNISILTALSIFSFSQTYYVSSLYSSISANEAQTDSILNMSMVRAPICNHRTVAGQVYYHASYLQSQQETACTTTRISPGVRSAGGITASCFATLSVSHCLV